MENKELKVRAKKNLLILDKHIQILQQARGSIGLLNDHAVNHQLHKRSINTRKALDGLNGLIEELQFGQSVCMEFLGARKIPIVEEKRLKLIVNNKKGDK